jgi:NAD(P)-dependent dehydrogenase (short-subunit alcohol dehydrogenase family)
LPSSLHRFISTVTAALSALTKSMAHELAPIRVNLVAAGSVDTPRSEATLGDRQDAQSEELRTTLPIRRVIGQPTSARSPFTS